MKEKIISAFRSIGHGADSLTIFQEVKRLTGRDLFFSDMYRELVQMVERGEVTTHRPDPPKELGGLMKRVFTLAAERTVQP